jgi:hypothetical protein
MRRLGCVILMVILAATALASAQDARRDQLAAATSRAVDLLRSQIAQEPIGRNLTVQDLLDRTNSSDTLTKTLQRSQMIGGARWIDQQTCQVRLDISGPKVAQALISIAASNPKKSPLAPEVLAAHLRDWDRRTFSATGTSTGAAAIDLVRPVEDGAAWARVNDAARQQAINAAKGDAIKRVLETIKPIPLAGGKTVDDALSVPEIRTPVEQWLAARPVTQVEFREDYQVRVALATAADELFDTFRSAVTSAKPPLAALDDATWDRVRKDFVTRIAPTSRGSARAGAIANSVTQMAIEVPQAIPDWVNDSVDAEGSAANTSKTKAPLKCARAAEADAQAKLRIKLESLPLSAGQTLGDVARQNPRVADAINRSLSRSKLTKVDYGSDGSAKVRLTLDLHDLWQEVQSAL